MASESLQSGTVSWHGLEGDRRWAFVRPGMERSGFPWLTIREKPDPWRYQPRFVDPDRPDSSKTLVRTPDGAELEVADPELARSLGEGVRVIRQAGDVFDTFPLSLLTVQSVESLSDLTGQSLRPLRFRPNLVVYAPDLAPFPEDQWVSRVLRIGSLRFRVDVRDPRCVMVNVDPEGGAPSPEILRAIAKDRDAHFGVYGSAVTPGEVSVGDTVWLEA